jgi:cell division protease FtsH
MQRDYSEQTARAIDEEVRTILDGAYAESKQILQEHRAQLDVVAGELLQRETLDAQTFKDLLKKSVSSDWPGVRA